MGGLSEFWNGLPEDTRNGLKRSLTGALIGGGIGGLGGALTGRGVGTGALLGAGVGAGIGYGAPRIQSWWDGLGQEQGPGQRPAPGPVTPPETAAEMRAREFPLVSLPETEPSQLAGPVAFKMPEFDDPLPLRVPGEEVQLKANPDGFVQNARRRGKGV